MSRTTMKVCFKIKMSKQIESTPLPPRGGAEDLTLGDDWDDPEMDDVLTQIQDMSVLENDESVKFDPKWPPRDLAKSLVEIPQDSSAKKSRHCTEILRRK